jgi:hypothetical protein
MDTQPDNGELLKELTQRLADADKAVHDLQEEVERKNKALEGFIAENEALKAELGGKPVTGAGAKRQGEKNITELVKRWRKSQEERSKA